MVRSRQSRAVNDLPGETTTVGSQGNILTASQGTILWLSHSSMRDSFEPGGSLAYSITRRPNSSFEPKGCNIVPSVSVGVSLKAYAAACLVLAISASSHFLSAVDMVLSY